MIAKEPSEQIQFGLVSGAIFWISISKIEIYIVESDKEDDLNLEDND